MPDDTTRRKTPAPQAPGKREIAEQAIAAYRAELAAKYEQDLAAWKDRRQAEIKRIREKLGRPGWLPGTRFSIEHIGPPPANPLALPFWAFPLP